MASQREARFSLTPPRPFDLRLVALSHGWFDLPPFRWEQERRRLEWVFEVGERMPVRARVWQRGPKLLGTLSAPRELLLEERRHAREVVRSCLRLDEDLASFHGVAAADERLAWTAARGAGRLLRAPTVFEDLIKVLCTTNCSWALTKLMVTRLVESLGTEHPGGGRSFPSAARMAQCDERFFRDRIRAGYRSPHLVKLARQVASGEIDPEAWRQDAAPAEQRYAELTELPGIGPYAAGSLLKLLGHYTEAALDSWCRARFRKIYGERRGKTDAAILRRYQHYGPWLGLALWLDLTAEWHRDETSVPL